MNNDIEKQGNDFVVKDCDNCEKCESLEKQIKILNGFLELEMENRNLMLKSWERSIDRM